MPVVKIEVTKDSIFELAKDQDVVAIIPNQQIHLIEPKFVEYDDLAKGEIKRKMTWGMSHLEIDKLWSTGNTHGKDKKVAVLDTGVYGVHAALQGRVKEFVVIDPLGRRINTSPEFDAHGHGTHVCGTIAGSDIGNIAIGVAPEAELYVAGVLVGEATLSTLIEGISWAVEQSVDIINMSLGFSYYEPKFDEIFKILLDLDVLPVVAIGNENHGNTSSPGSAQSALSVGALELAQSGQTDIASFSSGASLVFPSSTGTIRVDKPDVVAPGVQVLSAVPPRRGTHGLIEHGYMDGTSMATPHVSGVAALLMSARPNRSAREIANALRDTAEHPDGPTARPDNRWGYGTIRPLHALGVL
jgi:subtilisin family serine protease